MEKTNLIVFEKTEIKSLLSNLDVETKKVGPKEFILNEHRAIAECEECHQPMTLQNLGNIAHGSKLFFCDNPSCFASHLIKKKL